MRIATIGRGNVGSGLAERWRRAGHEVTTLGRDGGDVSGADVVLVAVPGAAVTEALRGVTGLEGRPVIDATNAVGERTTDHPSLAHEIRELTRGPVAKAFNANYGRLYDRIDDEARPPGCIYVADDAIRDVTEQLIRDAGYEPVSAGGLENARALEDFVTGLLFKIGRVFYRFGEPGEL